MLIGRTVLGEVSRNFLASLVATTSAAFFVLSISFLKRTPGVGMGFLVEVFPLFFPLALQFTVPLAVLVSVILTFGRMSVDRELTALRACGIAPMSIVRPVLAGAAVLSLAALLFSDLAAPFAAEQLRTAKRNLLHQLQTSFRAGLSDLRLGHGRISFESFEAGEFRDVCLEYKQSKEETHLWRAQRGSIVVTDDDRVLIELDNAQTVLPYGTEHGTVPVFVGNVQMEADLSELIGGRTMTRDSSDLIAWELAYVGERNIVKGPGTRVHTANAMEDLARRSALSAAALFFAWIGIPLGVLSARGGRIGAFLIAVAPVLLVYFPIVMTAANLARQGKVPCYASLWAGNLLLGAVGWLLWRKVVAR